MQEFPDGAAAHLGAAQDEPAVLRLHDLTVFVVQRSFVLEDDSYGPAVPLASSFYSVKTYPHNKRHVVFVVVSGAAAEDVQALVVAGATQLTDGKIQPGFKTTEYICSFDPGRCERARRRPTHERGP